MEIMMNPEDFLKELNEYMQAADAKELELKITGDLEEDQHIIDNPSKANYFLKILKRVEEDMAKINELADIELERTKNRIEEFRAGNLKGLVTQKHYYEQILMDYAKRETEGKKTKSVKLPYGTLSLRKVAPKFIYDDEVLVEWAKKNAPSLITVKTAEAVDKKEFKSIGQIENGTFKLAGEEVPGVQIVEQEDSFTVK
jgi:hypothetical protein